MLRWKQSSTSARREFCLRQHQPEPVIDMPASEQASAQTQAVPQTRLRQTEAMSALPDVKQTSHTEPQHLDSPKTFLGVSLNSILGSAFMLILVASGFFSYRGRTRSRKTES